MPVDVCIFGCVVPSVENRNRESWRLLVKEHIVIFAKRREGFYPIFRFDFFWVYWVLNKHTLHSGVVSRHSAVQCQY